MPFNPFHRCSRELQPGYAIHPRGFSWSDFDQMREGPVNDVLGEVKALGRKVPEEAKSPVRKVLVGMKMQTRQE